MFKNKNKHISKIELGDTLKGDFKVFIKDQEITKFSESKAIIVGKNEYLPKMDKALINRKVKAQMEVKILTPKAYEISELANAQVIVKISNLKLIKSKKNSEKEQEDFFDENNINNIVDKTKEMYENLGTPAANKFVIEHNDNNDEIAKLKKEIEALKEINSKNETKINELIATNKANEAAFIAKANNLTLKAKEELQKFKNDLTEKLNNEKEENKKYILSGFLEEFMIPYNNFKLAIKAGSNSADNVVKNFVYGFNMIDKQLQDVLENFGAFVIAPETLSEYDPEFHHAVEIIKDETKEDNSIKEIRSYGLSINGRVVRPAMVIIYKKN